MSDLDYPKVAYLDEYSNYLKTKGRAPRTIECYIQYLKNIPAEVEEYFSADLPNEMNVIPAYRSYLEFLCKKKRLITRGEFEDLKDNIKVPKKNSNNKHSERKFSVPENEWGNTIRQIPESVYKMGAWLGFHFGLRLGEICHLRVQDIDFSGEQVIIQSRRKQGHQVKWSAKYNKDRQIHFTNKSQAVTLKKWIDSIPEWVKTPYLLWTISGPRKGLILQDKAFYKNLRKAKSEGRKLRPHVLRYSFATHWYEKTKDIKFVSDMLGHSNVAMTSTYLCVGQKETKAKAKKYGEF